MMLSRGDLLDIQNALDDRIEQHMDVHSMESYLTCPYCSSLDSLIDALQAILWAMPMREEVWVS